MFEAGKHFMNQLMNEGRANRDGAVKLTDDERSSRATSHLDEDDEDDGGDAEILMTSMKMIRSILTK